MKEKATQFELRVELRGGVVTSVTVTYAGAKKVFGKEESAALITKVQIKALRGLPDGGWIASTVANLPATLSAALPTMLNNLLHDVIGYGELGRNHPDVPK